MDKQRKKKVTLVGAGLPASFRCKGSGRTSKNGHSFGGYYNQNGKRAQKWQGCDYILETNSKTFSLRTACKTKHIAAEHMI